MPGILGVAGPMSPEARASLAKRMAAAMQHEAWYRTDLQSYALVALGRVSLGILNPQPQPVGDDSSCLVMYGELYDSEAEKRSLQEKRYRFVLDNDAEFLLRRYEERSESFVDDLNGSFTLALWDGRQQKLVIANDRYGFRPLYYAVVKDRLLFAGELKALLADPDLSSQLDWPGLAEYLSLNYCLGDRTLLAAVKLLPPASILTWQSGKLTLRHYWDLRYRESYSPRSEDDYIEELRYHLRRAVARQTAHEETIGVYLSGGMDSRVITALINRQQTPTVHTFTFGLPGCEDDRFARRAAAALHTSHHFYPLSAGFLADYAAEIVRLTDGTLNCIHGHGVHILRAMRQHVRVTLNGLSGDMILGSFLTPDILAMQDDQKLAEMLFAKANNPFSEQELSCLLAPSLYAEVKGQAFAAFVMALHEAPASLAANKYDYYNLRQRQRRFIFSGITLSRSQVECRAPFYDNDLIDFVLGVPPELRLKERIYVQATCREFPALARIPWTKTGLPISATPRQVRTRQRWLALRKLATQATLGLIPLPHRAYADYNGWMRSVLRPFVESILLDERTEARSYFNHLYIRQLLEEHMQGRADYADKLGILITFELWNRLFLD